MSSWKLILLLPCYRFSVSACACRLPQLLVIPLLFVSKLRSIAASLYPLMAITIVYSNVGAVSAAWLPYCHPPVPRNVVFLTRLQNKALVPNRSTGDTGGLFKICEPVSIASGRVSSFHHVFVHHILCSGALSLDNGDFCCSLLTGVMLLVSFSLCFLGFGRRCLPMR